MLNETQLAGVRSETAAQELEKSFNRQVERADTVAKLRLEFFDRIVLLDGGTAALSVTLIGALISKGLPLNSVTLIVLSWAAFLVSMISALIRNWLEHNRLSTLEMNNYILALNQSQEANIRLAETVAGSSAETAQAREVLAEGVSVIGKQVKRHASLLHLTKIAGALSLGASLTAFIFLVIFAATNVRASQKTLAGTAAQDLFNRKRECEKYTQKVRDNLEQDQFVLETLHQVFYSPVKNSCLSAIVEWRHAQRNAPQSEVLRIDDVLTGGTVWLESYPKPMAPYQADSLLDEQVARLQ